MRIIQIIPTLAAGGLERVATTLAIGLAAGGDHVVVCTRGATDHRANELALQRAGVPIERVPRPTPAPRQLLRSARAIARVLRVHRPEVIHAHNPAAAAAAAVARVLALRPRTPIVTTFHGLVDGGTHVASRILNVTSAAVVGVGPAATAELLRAGVDEARLVTILNAVPAEAQRSRKAVREELGVADDADLVVTVGRYREEKDQDLLLRAAAILAPARPRLRVLLVGVGPLEDKLRARISELGLDAVACVTGLREDAVDIVAAADVATLTSKREGLGLSLIEAMWVGTPTVGTNIGGIPDVIDDGETGLLVPAGDAAALATAIAGLLDNPALANRLATAARASVEARFSIATMTAGYRAAYARVLAGRSRSARRRAGASPST
jgi:glycosyltransferase involved in cell wall biosynthesis